MKNRRPVPSPASIVRTRRLVETFIRTALPGGRECLGLPFHYQRWDHPGFWWPSMNGLTEGAIADHLAGGIVLAPRWPRKVDAVEVDIDAKDEAARRTLVDRLASVAEMLDFRHEKYRRPTATRGTMQRFPEVDPRDVVPFCIVWRSSPGRFGGYRLRILLDRPYPRDEVGKMVRDTLADVGLTPESGVEVFPLGERSSRAPLGRGSSLANPHGGRLTVEDFAAQTGIRLRLARDAANEFSPVGAVLRARRMVRNVAESVAAWAQLASVRVPLELVVGRRRARAKPCPPLYLKESWRKPASRARPIDERGQARKLGEPSLWQAHIALLEEHGAPYGGRNQALGDLVFDWFVRRGLSEDETLDRLAHWLHFAPHSSKDLTGYNADVVREQMRRSGSSLVAKLEHQLATGVLGTPAPPTSRPSSPHPLLSPMRLRAREGARWRDVAIALLPENQRVALLAIAPARLGRGVATLAGLLRELRLTAPGSTGVAVPKKVLQTLIGGRPLAPLVQGSTPSPLPYRELLEAAQRAGVLGSVLSSHDRAARRATVYTLPD